MPAPAYEAHLTHVRRHGLNLSAPLTISHHHEKMRTLDSGVVQRAGRTKERCMSTWEVIPVPDTLLVQLKCQFVVLVDFYPVISFGVAGLYQV